MRLQKLLFLALFSFLVFISMPTVSLATEYREVQASEILKQIENGEDVNLTNCRIIGELNLSEIQLETVPNPKYNELFESGDFNEGYLEYNGVNKDLMVIKSNIIIHNSVFESDLDFSNSLFKKSLSLVEANFSSSSYFISSSFEGDADFRGTSFGGDAIFRDTSFDGAAIFRDTSFGGDASFLGANFGGDAYFGVASFDGAADFRMASFGGAAIFYWASFGGDAYFGGASFDGAAFFNWAIFDGAANFRMASFGGDASFLGANFGGDADFRGTSFGGDADFREASFADTVYFSDTEFKTISLNNTDFKKMQISWNSLENSLVFDGPTYVKLIKNFRDLEQFDDADAAYFKYRKYCQAEKSWIPFSKEGSKWCDILMRFTCGYGVKPFRAFYLGGLIVLLFSFFYLGSPKLSWSNVGDADSAQKSATKILLNLIPKIDWPNPGISRLSDSNGSAQKVTFWDSFYFSVVTFSTIGFGDWYPKDSFRKWVMLEGLFGWITLSLFLVTLTNVMIRP